MGSLDPDRADTVIRGLPDCPSMMVTDDGEALSAITADTGGGGEVTGGVVGGLPGAPESDAELPPHCGAYGTGAEIWFFRLGFPMACTNNL